MSSWYVLSAMGFYPVCPGRPVYDIGSPIFEETRIALENGKVFTVIAQDVSARNKYIQRAELNGKTWARPWFEHSDLINGGTLILQVGSRPNKAWGSTLEAAPPSMSQRSGKRISARSARSEPFDFEANSFQLSYDSRGPGRELGPGRGLRK